MKSNIKFDADFINTVTWIVWFVIFMILAFGCVRKNHPQLSNYEYYGNRQVPTWNVFIDKDSVDKNEHKFKDPIQDSLNDVIDKYYVR